MATQVLMPQLGESVEEATITKWLKAEGDSVEEFEALVEVNTDKVDTEIPAPASGTLLKILQPEEGAVIKVGMILAWIGEPGEEIPTGESAPDMEVQAETQRAEEPPMVAATPEASPVPSANQESTKDLGPKQSLGFISPVVAKIAAEHGVNLQLVQGTGLKGRITKKDVLAYVEQAQLPGGDQASGAVAPRTPPTAPSAGISDTLIPHTTIRRRIAEHMVLSKRTSPHVTTVFEADLSKVVAHRAANQEAFARDGHKLTFTAYFVAATAAALKAFPVVNSSWSEEGLILRREINIGMATSLGEEGLIVPVIKRANELSLVGISRSVNDPANRGRAKQLQPDEVGGGTFTITNHGVSGSLFAMPIISQPQTAILGVGKLQKRAGQTH
jgi:2-oxoglutarate dehydrogenase E2 component (dihydrolipoamide succinyltransferase)